MAGKPINDYYCNEHTDCAVKNVGNCCGNFPECVSVSFCPDLPSVESWCKSNDISSVCGWHNVQACVCENKKCQGVQCADGNCASPEITYQESALAKNIPSDDINCVNSDVSPGTRAADFTVLRSVPSVLMVLASLALLRFCRT
mmetsp:Transcript_26191/g.77483  ORF Transcript_26191/g.77483 Transcript_26191/m.77483 type:complete len:144 (-) Transcript_26191:428-859(-)|eukprot:CAMPEP_0113559456 /NCGR_PEP_ID=MMETSP0015_2-20120614/18907_1 /TAXON_ID=2838 /ORGANISM="Odontella" /LENGTH=143 /DNA_ID=CAMNT_0000461095 /DNA_START=225 /DNA_END=656 /DNA_ORIENTATION=+ /assembly_acc=CAM_ASM_000160